MRISSSLLNAVHMSGRVISAAATWGVPTAIFGSAAWYGVNTELGYKAEGKGRHITLGSGCTGLRATFLIRGKASEERINLGLQPKGFTVWTGADVANRSTFVAAIRPLIVKWLTLSTVAYAGLLLVFKGRETFCSLANAAQALGSVALHGLDGVVAASAVTLLFVAGQAEDRQDPPSKKGFLCLGLGGLYFVFRGLSGLAEAVSPGCRLRALLKLVGRS